MGAVESAIRCPSECADTKARTVRLNVVAFVPQEQRQDMDRLMREQGQSWCGGSSISGDQSPLVRYAFLSDRRTIARMERSLRAMLQAMDVKFHTFVLTSAADTVD
jgi:hypothetical protein